jgi:hypothetical protein
MRLRSVIFAAVVNTMVAGQLADLPRWQLAQQLAFGQRCQTGQGWCFMAAPAPLGSACFCPTPFGAVPGFVVQ